MPLTLVATAGDSAANSYATVSDADAVAGYRMSGPALAWADLDASQKIQALVTATRDLDTEPWRGDRASDTQALEWPRQNTDYSSSVIPGRLRDAVIELAFVYAAQGVADTTADPYAVSNGNGNIQQDTVGPITTRYFAPQTPLDGTLPSPALERLPAIVQRLIAPLVVAPVLNYGSGSAVRTS